MVCIYISLIDKLFVIEFLCDALDTSAMCQSCQLSAINGNVGCLSVTIYVVKCV
jgi:hypothetical protein